MKTSEEIFKNIKTRLYIAAKAQHITMEELRKDCDIMEKAIEDLSIVDLIHISEYLSVSIDYLLGVKELDKATTLAIYKNQMSRIEAFREIRQSIDKIIVKEKKQLSNITNK